MYKFLSLSLVLLAAHLVRSQRVLSRPLAPEEDESPKPYTFTYDTQDEYGNTVTRTESGDGSGTVKGSYSYQNTEGVFRVVEYLADASGVRYAIRTNEPGTGKTENGDPADVAMEIEPTPQGVVERWANLQRTPAAQPGRVGSRNTFILRKK